MMRQDRFLILGVCTSITVIVLLSVCELWGAECRSDSYGQATFADPKTDFSPYDKVFVKVNCDSLEPGEHTLYVNWIHGKKGIIRSDKKSFSIQDRKTGYSAYFWFKLSRQGPIKSTFTNHDFYPGHLGNWVFEAILGDEPVCSSSFTILETN